MPKHGKKYRASAAKVDQAKAYTIEEAVKLAKQTAFAKFDESLNIDLRLGVDPRQADQQVRGTVPLPHGTGRTVRVAVFAQGADADAARAAGADIVGAEDLVNTIKEGKMDFDLCIATPEMMRFVGQVGRILGPRGLMPNPKSGTVTKNVTEAVTSAKAGRVEFRLDRTAIVHNVVGRVSFTAEKLAENIHAYLDAVRKARPASAKGSFIRSAFISSTMGPGIRLDVQG